MKKFNAFIISLIALTLLLTACQAGEDGAQRQAGDDTNITRLGTGDGQDGNRNTHPYYNRQNQDNLRFPYENDDINYQLRGRENVNDWQPFDFNNRRSGRQGQQGQQGQGGLGDILGGQDREQQTERRDRNQQGQQDQQEQQRGQDQQQEETPDRSEEAREQDGQQDETPDVQTDHSVIEEVVRLTNEQREQHGLNPVELDTQLTDVAQRKSVDMADNNYFSHNSPTYGSPFDMLDHYDVSYTGASENIAAGQHSAEEAVNNWMNSEGHRENILNESWTHIGVGYEDSGNMSPYWTQMFIVK
ncbi:putative YkwD family protein [Alkalibacillus filiformis]|uniref:YkwD family protein n=1 Tax=Alkalibacillus filiformis TaxID=200990 RepID=A0ABU0DQB4_9BACI|nr:CAP domain-containing protein [Alkalibacillus filiformis]MDQ0350395.1 putative YkwD family protein [Alkalibacillus filiformis]